MRENYKIKQAALHITYACEHQCPMCYANSGRNKEHPSFEQLCKVIDCLLEADVKDITLLGGDPAIYSHIIDLVKYAKQRGAMLSILSNTLDFLGKRSEVLEYIDVYEGTIHHADPRKHDLFCKVDGAYEKLIGNLKFFSEKGKSIGLALNIIPYNYDVIKDLVETVMEKGILIDHIVIQRIIQFGRATGMSDFEISKDMLNSALKQVADLEKKYDIKIIFEDPMPLCTVKPQYWKYIHPCEWGISKISVDYDGKVSRCGADVFHSLGSIFDNIEEIWNTNEKLKEFREKHYLPGKCQKCKMLEQCGGGCPISRNPSKGLSLDYLCSHEGV